MEDQQKNMPTIEPDEAGFYEKAQDWLKSAANLSEGISMYAVEIENFHIYNLWHGREAGQQFAADMYARLDAFAGKHGGIAGYFGDAHFAYLGPERENMVNELQTYLSENRPPEEGAGFHPMIGIYHTEDCAQDAEVMYDRAAVALDAIRGNYAMRYMHYNTDMDKELDDEILMLADIRRGLLEHEFTFFLQPKCDMRSGKILGAEALVRWIHKDQGMVSPGKFIPLLEKSGFTAIVDQVIWEDVIRWQRERIEQGFQPLPVSVNVSKTDLFAINVADTLIGLCAKHKVPHHLIELEITESAYAEYFDEIKGTINELKQAGFPMLMDDFGSGYSSLNMLKKIDFDILKFDMKFLRADEAERERGIEILESVVNMARLLIVPVIIEGVETQEQVEYLTEMGCRYAQGYFYYKPMPVADFVKLISDETNVNHDGYVTKRVEQIHMREFLEDMPATEMMINNMMGPVGFYDLYEDHIEIIRVNEPYYNLFGAGASKSLTVIREHTSAEDYECIKELLAQAENTPMKGSKGTFHYRREDGVALPVLFRVFYLHERNGHKRFYGSVTDLSDLGKQIGQSPV